MIAPDEFSDPLHARLFSTMGEMHGGGHLVSPLTLAARLASDEGLRQVGGAEYLKSLARAAPVMPSVAAWAAIIRDLAARRQLEAHLEAAGERIACTDIPIADALEDLRKVSRHALARTTPQERLSLSFSDLLAVEAPPRRALLNPWLMRGGSSMIHAWRGIGKTHVAVWVAVAVASGGQVLRWSATEPSRVLFVDGEMPFNLLQERFRAAIQSLPTIPSGDFLRIITPDKLPGNRTVPNLLAAEGQAAIEPDLEGCALVIFDNVATLFRNAANQNDAGAWVAAQDYILRLRRRGMAVVIVDHDSKAGGNRGTSAKHDILDAVIQLKRPRNYRETQGARFSVEFTKARGFWGRDAAPFEAQLIETPDGLKWTVVDADDVLVTRVGEMMRDGCTQRDIRQELGIGGSKLARLKVAVQNQGGAGA